MARVFNSTFNLSFGQRVSWTMFAEHILRIAKGHSPERGERRRGGKPLGACWRKVGPCIPCWCMESSAACDVARPRRRSRRFKGLWFAGVSKAVLAGIAAVACLSVLIVGAASSRLQGPADLLVCPPCLPLRLQSHPFAARLACFCATPATSGADV